MDLKEKCYDINAAYNLKHYLCSIYALYAAPPELLHGQRITLSVSLESDERRFIGHLDSQPWTLPEYVSANEPCSFDPAMLTICPAASLTYEDITALHAISIQHTESQDPMNATWLPLAVADPSLDIGWTNGGGSCIPPSYP